MEKFDQDFNLKTGLKTEYGFVEDKMVVHKTIDLEPLIEYTTKLRNADDYSKEGIKKGFFHVAEIDAVTVLELYKMGVDVYTAPVKEIVAGIKRLNKDHLLTTRKRV